MAKRKFRIAVPRLKIVNRCIMCGKVVRMDQAICGGCDKKRLKGLKKS